MMGAVKEIWADNIEERLSWAAGAMGVSEAEVVQDYEDERRHMGVEEYILNLRKKKMK